MKKMLVLLVIVFAIPAIAQISLEHTYYEPNARIGLYQIDSSEFKYIRSQRYDSIFVYNLDHSLYQLFIIPKDTTAIRSEYSLLYASRKLFNTDDQIEFLISGTHLNSITSPFLKVFNENGEVQFECDSCRLFKYQPESSGLPQETIVNTNDGVKMFVFKTIELSTQIYSLPGKLPTSNTKLSVTDAPTIISSSSPSTSAYPNPSNGKIRVAYSLPEGVTTGELVITSTDGREVKRYRVGNMFNDILIEKSELASGAYFYKLITERGESEARKFVITN